MISGASVSSGLRATAGPPTSRSSTTTKRKSDMARTAIHPGDHLAEELSALEMSAAELARHLKVPTNRVTAILNGRRAITGDTALRLGQVFGTSPQFWLNLQTLYDLRVAERRAGRTINALPKLKRARAKHEGPTAPA